MTRFLFPVVFVVGCVDTPEKLSQSQADGATIFYTLDDGTSSSIWRLRLRGGETEQLTTGFHDLHPKVSPSGNLVAFESPDRPEGHRIYLLDLDTKSVIPIGGEDFEVHGLDFGASDDELVYVGKGGCTETLRTLTRDTVTGKWAEALLLDEAEALTLPETRPGDPDLVAFKSNSCDADCADFVRVIRRSTAETHAVTKPICGGRPRWSRSGDRLMWLLDVSPSPSQLMWKADLTSDADGTAVPSFPGAVNWFTFVGEDTLLHNTAGELATFVLRDLQGKALDQWVVPTGKTPVEVEISDVTYP